MKERVHLFYISVKVGNNNSDEDGMEGKAKDKFPVRVKSCCKIFNMGGLVMDLKKSNQIYKSDEYGFTVYVEEMIPI